MAEITPITLVIGLPGAGKTTLLRDLLRRPLRQQARQGPPLMA